MSWIIAAGWAAPSVARSPSSEQRPYQLLQIGGGLLLFLSALQAGLPDFLFWQSIELAWLLMLVMLAGFGVAWWARLHLGGLWSLNITLKQDHLLVRTGPYGIVRHPIYTGLLIAVLASAVALGHLGGLIGAALIIAGIVLKARLEEHVLSASFSDGDYAKYQREVPMLVPFWPTRS